MKNEHQRQQEALLRQEAYSKLTPQQKLALLDQYKLIASRQRAKLLKQINKQTSSPKEEVTTQSEEPRELNVVL